MGKKPAWPSVANWMAEGTGQPLKALENGTLMMKLVHWKGEHGLVIWRILKFLSWCVLFSRGLENRGEMHVKS